MAPNRLREKPVETGALRRLKIINVVYRDKFNFGSVWKTRRFVENETAGSYARAK